MLIKSIIQKKKLTSPVNLPPNHSSYPKGFSSQLHRSPPVPGQKNLPTNHCSSLEKSARSHKNQNQNPPPENSVRGSRHNRRSWISRWIQETTASFQQRLRKRTEKKSGRLCFVNGNGKRGSNNRKGCGFVDINIW